MEKEKLQEIFISSEFEIVQFWAAKLRNIYKDAKTAFGQILWQLILEITHTGHAIRRIDLCQSNICSLKEENLEKIRWSWSATGHSYKIVTSSYHPAFNYANPSDGQECRSYMYIYDYFIYIYITSVCALHERQFVSVSITNSLTFRNLASYI